jgi:PST family polysaccharide transporter
MASIKSQFLSSSIWAIVGRGLSNLSTFLIFALLARYLGPSEFGLVAFASVFVDIAQSLAAAGITQALVQRATWDEKTSSTAFWTNLAFASCLAVIMSVAVAPAVSWAFDPRLGPLIVGLATTFVINAARGAHEALLQREFRFRFLATSALIATILGGITGVAMAVYGFGAWSLVFSRIVAAVCQTILVWISVRWTPKWQFSKPDARKLLEFGIHLSGATVLSQLSGRVPELVIGWFIGPAGVGIFRVASRGIGMLSDLAITPIQTTSLVALSRLKDPPAVGSAYVRLVKACSILAMPIYLGAAVVAHDFVVICFGKAWEAAGPVMALLAIGGAATTISYFSQPVLTALGKSGATLVTSFGALMGNMAAAGATVAFGLTWVALGVSVRAYFSTPLGLFLISRSTGISVISVLRSIAPAAISAFIMAIALISLQRALLADSSPILRLCLMVPIGAAVYGALMMLIGRRLVADIQTEFQPYLNALFKKRR